MLVTCYAPMCSHIMLPAGEATDFDKMLLVMMFHVCPPKRPATPWQESHDLSVDTCLKAAWSLVFGRADRLVAIVMVAHSDPAPKNTLD